MHLSSQVCSMHLPSYPIESVEGQQLCERHVTLLEKAKLAREINNGKNEIPHEFLGRKF